MAKRIADLILWLFRPLHAYLNKIERASFQASFGVNGPFTWRDLSPFSPARSVVVDQDES